MPLRFTPFLLLLALAVPVRAQSGMASFSGSVYSEDPHDPMRPGGWYREGLADDAYHDGSPTVKLVAIAAHGRAESFAVRGLGPFGAFDFGRIPMGHYRLLITAKGHEPWEAELYVPSDSTTELHVLLRQREEAVSESG